MSHVDEWHTAFYSNGGSVTAELNRLIAYSLSTLVPQNPSIISQ